MILDSGLLFWATLYKTWNVINFGVGGGSSPLDPLLFTTHGRRWLYIQYTTFSTHCW